MNGNDNWLEQIKAAALIEDWNEAIRIAVRFRALGKQKDAITKAWSAIQNPEFYRQIKVDPEIAIAKGIEALKERYEL